jgi:hypothetical protein
MTSPPPPLHPRPHVQLDLGEAIAEANALERGARANSDAGMEGILGVADADNRCGQRGHGPR